MQNIYKMAERATKSKNDYAYRWYTGSYWMCMQKKDRVIGKNFVVTSTFFENPLDWISIKFETIEIFFD